MESVTRTDTIAALATPPGRGGIAIVRVTGADAEEMLRRFFQPARKTQALESHRLMYGAIHDDGGAVDDCMAVLMRAPRSYTREDVAEFHLHGGEYVAQRMLRALWAAGVRPAEAGEFTQRAFLNGRLDLSRAEAVMQLISATGQRAHQAALRDLRGGASAFVLEAQRQLVDILAGVAAALDYPEEVEEEEAVADLLPRIRSLAGTLRAACDERAARWLETGMEVAIAGRPNVGKSSLLNLLLGEERAIVTEEAGTTRDIVRGTAQIGGLRVNFSDTAGIRDSDQQVERIGIQRARAAMEAADLVLLVLDQALPMSAEDGALLRSLQGRPHLVVLNKSDLPAQAGLPQGLLISARTGEGVAALRQAIADHAGQPDEGGLHAARHMRLAADAARSLDDAAGAMNAGDPLDLCAVHLSEALRTLGQITGDEVTEELLDQVFSTFCVGK